MADDVLPTPAPQPAPAPAPAPVNDSPKPARNPLLDMPDDMVPDSWREHVRELRRENRKVRDETESAVSKVKNEYEGQISALRKSSEERLLRSELKAAAIKAGMIDLDGLKLADLSTVKLLENGDVEGADALMASLKESKPYLFGAANSSSTPGQKPTPKPAEPKSAKDMDPDEYRKAKAALVQR